MNNIKFPNVNHLASTHSRCLIPRRQDPGKRRRFNTSYTSCLKSSFLSILIWIGGTCDPATLAFAPQPQTS